jgi:hypothetical protein
MQANWLEILRWMNLTQRLILIALVVGSVGLWFALYRLVFRPWRRRRQGRPLAAPPALWQRLAIAVLCLFYVLIYLYARFDEPNRLVLKHLRLTSAKIPAGVTLRLAHATDLHAEPPRQRQLERAAEAIAALQPDAVFLTGDYLCDLTPAAMTVLLDFLLRLPDAPVFVVPGNYEGRFPSDGLFETLGMDVMHTETRLTTIKGVPLEIHGASPARRILAARARQAPERFGILWSTFPRNCRKRPLPVGIWRCSATPTADKFACPVTARCSPWMPPVKSLKWAPIAWGERLALSAPASAWSAAACRRSGC